MKLVSDSDRSLFCLQGSILLQSLVDILGTGSIGSLLTAITYQNLGLSGDFYVPPGGMTKDFTITNSILFGPILTMSISQLPSVASSWSTGWSRRAFLFGLGDVSGANGTGDLVPLNIVLKSGDGSYSVRVPSKSGLLAGATYMGLGVATPLTRTATPSPDTGSARC